MKKVLLTLALVAMFGFVNAQTEEGGWLVGGSSNLGLNFAKAKDVDAVSIFNLNVKAGYFLSDNIVAGVGVGIFKVEDIDATTSLGIFGRYYFSDLYAGAGLDFTDNGIDNGTWINLELGYPVFLTDNIALEPNLSYSIGGGDANEDLSRFGLNFGFFLYL